MTCALRRSALTLGVLVLATTVLGAQNWSDKRTPRIVPGDQIRSIVSTETGSTRFSLAVPTNAFLLDIQIDDSPADLDIILYRDGDLVAFSELTQFNEHLRLTRISDPALESGTYEIEIAYQYPQAPIVDGQTLTEIPFGLTVGLPTPVTRSTLRPGDAIRDRLQPAEGMIAIYDIEVPEGAAALRIDISETSADVDLFLNRLDVTLDLFESDHWAQTIRSTETLVVDADSRPALQAGRYSLVVIDQLVADYETEFDLSISASAEAPAALRGPIQRLPTPERDLDRAVLATVELLTESGGGSGVIVSPTGHILSNWHVVVADSGDPQEEISVGISIDPSLPAEEIFMARVVDAIPERDLALLEITSGRYGQPIPRGMRFPYLECAPIDSARIGDQLHLLGYPSIGGTGSRVSITYSRGVVAGFQTVPFGRLIKTDGEINEGSSGGAALDERFELLGLPTEVVGLDAGQIAYIYPVSAIPSSWRQIIRR